jgi:hypothetical protein
MLNQLQEEEDWDSSTHLIFFSLSADKDAAAGETSWAFIGEWAPSLQSSCHMIESPIPFLKPSDLQVLDLHPFCSARKNNFDSWTTCTQQLALEHFKLLPTSELCYCFLIDTYTLLIDRFPLISEDFRGAELQNSQSSALSEYYCLLGISPMMKNSW